MEQITQIAAVMIAGAWAYYYYFRGRTFRPRLEPVVEGEVVTRGGDDFIVATATAKNVGLSKVAVQRDGTGLRFSVFAGLGGPFVDIDWAFRAAFDIFTSHAWIEPGETVVDQLLVKIAAGQSFAKLELRIVSGRYAWNVDRIVPIRPDNEKPTLA